MLSDEERAMFADRLGPGAHVELPSVAEYGIEERWQPYALLVRCTVGDWTKGWLVQSVHRLDVPGEARTGALQHCAFGFKDAAPHLFPVAGPA